MLIHKLFFLTQNLSWFISGSFLVELPCWHFGIHHWV